MTHSDLIGTVAPIALFGGMTSNERRLGRFIRDGEGHPVPAAGSEAAPAAPDANAMPEIDKAADTSEADDAALAAELDKEFGGGGDAPADEAKPKADEPDAGKPKEPEAAPEVKSPAVLAAEERAAAAERDAAFWRSKAEGKPAGTPAAGTEEAKAPAEPKAEDYEFGEADTKFIADTARWHAKQEFASQQAEAETRAEMSRLEANYQGKIAEAVERYPDYDDKVTKTAAKGEWPCPPIVALGIRDSEVGPDVAYHLATNLSDAKRIADLSPLEQAREFGRLENRFMTEAAARATAKADKQPAPKTVTEAPAPPANISRGAGGRFAVAADTDDFAAFEASADAMLKSK